MKLVIAKSEAVGKDVLAQIDCPEKDVERLVHVFELFDKKIKDFKPKK